MCGIETSKVFSCFGNFVLVKNLWLLYFLIWLLNKKIGLREKSKAVYAGVFFLHAGIESSFKKTQVKIMIWPKKL